MRAKLGDVVMKLRTLISILISIPCLISADAFVFGVTHSLQDFLDEHNSSFAYNDIIEQDEEVQVAHIGFESPYDDYDDVELAFPSAPHNYVFETNFALNNELNHELLSDVDEEIQVQELSQPCYECYGQGARMMPKNVSLQTKIVWLINDGTPDSLYKADRFIRKGKEFPDEHHQLTRYERCQYRRMLTNRKRILAGKEPIRVRIPGEIKRAAAPAA